ncbi:MAG: hypothetical protein ACRDBY_14315 [Cetobacterium sp.]
MIKSNKFVLLECILLAVEEDLEVGDTIGCVTNENTKYVLTIHYLEQGVAMFVVGNPKTSERKIVVVSEGAEEIERDFKLFTDGLVGMDELYDGLVDLTEELVDIITE